MTVYARKQAWCDWHKERPRVNVSIVVFVSTRPGAATQSERRAGVRESTRRGTRCVSATVDERV